MNESDTILERWQQELARHVAYIPLLAEQAGVSRIEVIQALDMMFYTHKLSKQSGGCMQ